MSAEHTPGPWTLGRTVSGKQWVYGPDGTRVGKAASGRRESERDANAHLIAAAPELLEALRTAKRVLFEAWSASQAATTQGLPPSAFVLDRGAWDAIEAAIAKAEGDR